jgi:hypothetical protein
MKRREEKRKEEKRKGICESLDGFGIKSLPNGREDVYLAFEISVSRKPSLLIEEEKKNLKKISWMILKF